MHTETRKFIRRMCVANPLWGAPRIHGELLKLGIKVSQATVARYMLRRSNPQFSPPIRMRNTIPCVMKSSGTTTVGMK